MIKKLSVTNFKSVAHAEIDVRPLTLLVGPNSAGKSSLIQPLLLLRQTIDARDVTNPLALHGDYIDFGNYRDFVFGHDPKKRLRFQIVFDTPQPTPWVLARSEPLSVSFSVEFAYIVKSRRVVVNNIAFSAAKAEMDFTVTRQPLDKYSAAYRHDGESTSLQVDSIRKFYGPNVSPVTPADLKASKLTTKQLRKEFEKSYGAQLRVGSLVGSVERLFNRVFYIGPLREWPKRSYVARGETPQDVGLKGERAVDVLLSQTRKKATRQKILPRIDEWLKRFGVASQIKLEPLGSNNYEIRLVEAQNRLPVNLADTGFGISQVLPVIIEGFYAPIGSVLLIEQPEIHLHPKAQATLADLLIDIVQQQRQTLLVETHSEHLIMRLQRRIAEEQIKVDDVALYYCEPSPAGTTVRRINFDANGQFVEEGLPEGFFEEDYKESLEHMKAIAKRKAS